MNQSGPAERELLLGILALQNGFVSQEQLLNGFRQWTIDKSRGLADVLVSLGALNPAIEPALQALVTAHIQTHDNSAELSLASVQVLDDDLSEQLKQIDDADIQGSMSGIYDALAGRQPANSELSLTLAMGKSSGDCGRFRILRPHRRGGLGEVFVAKDEELDREVALKQILRRRVDDEEQRFRFMREAEITGKLEHPGVVPVYGLGEDEVGRPYYVMRFIRGRTMREALESFHAEDNSKNVDSTERNKEFRRLLGWFIDVCQAINYAHSRGVLHRDLKPSNVMLGRYGETLVVDWGLARVAGADDKFSDDSDEKPVYANLSGGSSETVDGTAVGTPAYMSPEQAEGRLDLLSPATDVYGLGATLFAILTGKPPLEGKAVDILPRVVAGAIPDPREVNSAAPAALSAVCLKAMSRNRLDRYQSTQELAADIEAWLADEPVSACAEPLHERARRWARRNRTVVSTLLAAVVVIATCATIAAGLLGRKNEQLELANNSISRTNAQLQESYKETETARQRADSVKNYLVSAFRSADPAVDGRQLTVAEVLQRSLKELDEQLLDDDATRADLLASIGTSYLGLGLYNETKDVFEKEYLLRQQLHGDTAPETLRASYHLALSMHYVGEYEQAIDSFRQTLDQQKMVLGEDHDDVLRTMNGLAIALGSNGQLAESMHLYEQIHEIRRENKKTEPQELLLSVNNLASSYQTNGKLKEAHELFENNLASYREELGPQHLQTLRAMDRLASIKNMLGEADKAIELYEEALALRRERLGNDHPSTVESLAGLGFAYRDAARLDEARELLEEALDSRKRMYGDTHPLTLGSMTDVARIYMSLGKFDEAIALAEQSVAGCDAAFNDNNPKLLAALNTQGMLYFRQGRPADALPVFERLLKLYVEEYSDDHPTTNSIRNNLAMTYRSVGKLRESVPLFEKTLKWRVSEFGEEHPKTLISMQNLDSIWVSLGRLQETLPNAEATLKRHRDQLGNEHRYTLSSMEILARLYCQLGMFRKAAPLADETLAIAKESLGNKHPDTAKAMDAVATVYLRSGETAKAIELFERTLALRKEILDAEHPATLGTTIRLAECFLAENASDKARSLSAAAHQSALSKLGQENPVTLRAASIVGMALTDLNEAVAARKLLQSTLNTQQQLLGEVHPTTLRTQFALGKALLELNETEQAIELFKETVVRQAQSLPNDHPDIFRSQFALATAFMSDEQFDEARRVLSDAAKQFSQPPEHALPVEIAIAVQLTEATSKLPQQPDR